MARLTHDDCYEELSNEPMYSMAIIKLKAYEDTGLSPAEVKALMAYAKNSKKDSKLDYHCTCPDVSI